MTCPSCTALAEQNRVYRETLEGLRGPLACGLEDGKCQVHMRIAQCEAHQALSTPPNIPSTDLQRARERVIEAAKLYVDGNNCHPSNMCYSECLKYAREELKESISDLAKVEGKSNDQ